LSSTSHTQSINVKLNFKFNTVAVFPEGEPVCVLEKKLNRDDWLMAALNTLLNEGIANVKILQLAKELGASRGSFYWHFQNREELLLSMLNFWEKETTDTLIKATNELPGPAMKKLCYLMESVLRNDMELYDQSIRAWARFDSMAANFLTRVDDKRYEFITGILRDCGVPDKEMDDRARILMVYLAGDASTMTKEDVANQKESIATKAAILAGTPLPQ
jgi:AcrR family transcriptional regulator